MQHLALAAVAAELHISTNDIAWNYGHLDGVHDCCTPENLYQSVRRVACHTGTVVFHG
jgi:hypothetical protein